MPSDTIAGPPGDNTLSGGVRDGADLLGASGGAADQIVTFTADQAGTLSNSTEDGAQIGEIALTCCRMAHR